MNQYLQEYKHLPRKKQVNQKFQLDITSKNNFYIFCLLYKRVDDWFSRLKQGPASLPLPGLAGPIEHRVYVSCQHQKLGFLMASLF